ncbi:MAG: amidase [Halioglobus sp.]
MPKTIHGFCDDVLGDHDAVELASLIAGGELKPSEVIEATIARANQVDPHLHAIVAQGYDQSLANASGNLSGPFAGVPTFIKDMNDVIGMPTRYGSAAYEGAQPATRNDPVVQQMVDLGLVPLGKTTMPEFGLICSAEPPEGVGEPTRNPWNTAHSVGGSSSGSAALVAAGVVPIGHAADGGGSIRIPAGSCGLVGLKPSRGRVIASRMLAKQPIEFAIDGIVTRSVRDTAHFYAHMEGLYSNPALEPIGSVTTPTEQKLRIGVVTASLGGVQIDQPTRAALDQTIKLLEGLGHTVELMPIPAPESMLQDFVNMWSASAYGTKKSGGKLLDPSFDDTQLTPVVDGLAKNFKKKILKIPGTYLRLKKSYKDWANVFTTLDVVMTPCVSHLTPEIGYLSEGLDYDTLFPRVMKWACFTGLANATGGPSISLPLGHDADTNLPIGVLFNADHGKERLLLELAYQLEEAQPWRKIE